MQPTTCGCESEVRILISRSMRLSSASSDGEMLMILTATSCEDLRSIAWKTTLSPPLLTERTISKRPAMTSPGLKCRHLTPRFASRSRGEERRDRDEMNELEHCE